MEYRKEDDSKKIRALTEEEATGLVEDGSGWFRPVSLTALHTGLREGELINLEWDDVDFKEEIVRVKRKPWWIPTSSGRTLATGPKNRE
ncbi:MAG: tyrosine-type recombinase/integrase [Sedimentisphaerales bacterium]|nr:tyrosine-type recombinase/integrase [Sedimentisphaerales bacterium]